MIAHTTEKVVVVVANFLSRQIFAISNAEVSESLKNLTLEWLDVAVEEIKERVEDFVADVW